MSGLSRLKLAVMAPFIAFVAIVGLAVGTVGYLQWRQGDLRTSADLSRSVAEIFETAVSADVRMMSAALQAVAENPSLKEAFLADDRDRLQRLSLPLFARLHRDHHITHFYFSGPDRVNVLRVHQPDRRGDLIDRISTRDAERTGAISHAIELGPLGTMTLRVVLPWRDGGRVIGYIELGEEIDHLFGEVRRRTGIQPLVLQPKARLSREGWEAGMRMLGRSARWDEFDDVVPALREGVPTEVIRRFRAGRPADEAVEVDGRWYSWTRLPVGDGDGPALEVGVVRDVTAERAAARDLAVKLIGGVIAGCLAVVAVFWLIMERLENRLFVTEATLSAALEQGPAPMVITDAAGIITYVNPSYSAYSGYAPDELLGSRPSILKSGQTPAETYEDLWRTITAGRVWKGEFLNRRKGGELFTDQALISPIIDTKGRITNFIGVKEDITARRDAELRLRDSEERFRTLIEGTTDWVWETDRDLRFTWLSDSFRRVTGLEPSGLYGRSIADLSKTDHDLGAADWAEHLADLRARRPFRDFRCWTRSAEGRPMWISLSGAPRFDEHGAFLGYRGSGADITARAALSARLRTLSAVVDQSPIAVAIADPDGTITYVNGHFLSVEGEAGRDAVGRRAPELCLGQVDRATLAAAWKTVRAGGRWSGEVPRRRPDGTAGWEMVMAFPVMNDEGKVAHVVSIKEDVTLRREGERALAEANVALERRAEEMAAVNAELEQFAYVVSHDLRQPLRMISSYITLMGRSLGTAISEEQKTFLDFAVDGAKRMDRLIVDLLDYSRAGRRTNPVRPVSLGQAVAESLGNLSAEIQEAGAEVTVSPDLPSVMGDSGELMRLFQNLIGNAIKYRAADRAPRITVSCRRDHGHWVLSVTDNGIGIAAEDCERAFGIFQRLVGREAYEGTGIGLAVCRKIVESHGGRIWIESEPGKGSTVLIRLPEAREINPPAATRSPAVPA